MSTIKVSIIIPVYNPGERIARCINSLRNQTLHDIEMIFVDDCCTDSSIRFISEAADEDWRIRILRNEKNRGPGFSRNVGIEAANGEYLAFVDPDDFVANDFFEILYEKAKISKPDIVKGERLRADIEGNILSQQGKPMNIMIRKGLNDGKHLYQLFTFCHVSALYRRNYIIQTGVKYGLSYNSEDTVFLLKACMYAKSIVFADEAIYFHVVRPDSRTMDYSTKRLRYEWASLREVADFLQTETEDGVPDTAMYNYFSGMTRGILQREAVTESDPAKKAETRAFLEEFHQWYVMLPFAHLLSIIQNEVREFVLYGVNLTIRDNVFWGGYTPIADNERMNRLERWVDFLSNHPEKQGEYQERFRKIFLQDYEALSKESRRQLPALVKKLEPSDILTGESLTMKLFVHYNLDLFAVRKSRLGYPAKKVLSIIRKLRLNRLMRKY